DARRAVGQVGRRTEVGPVDLELHRAGGRHACRGGGNCGGEGDRLAVGRAGGVVAGQGGGGRHLAQDRERAQRGVAGQRVADQRGAAQVEEVGPAAGLDGDVAGGAGQVDEGVVARGAYERVVAAATVHRRAVALRCPTGRGGQAVHQQLVVAGRLLPQGVHADV